MLPKTPSRNTAVLDNKVGSHNAIWAQRSFLCGSHGADGTSPRQ